MQRDLKLEAVVVAKYAAVAPVLDERSRRVCRVVGHARATQRHHAAVPSDEPPLVSRLIALASAYGRYGYRRVTALLRREGWRVNHKRVARLWRREGLKVPQKQAKRGRLWSRTDRACVSGRRTATTSGRGSRSPRP